jgi:transcriptional regulator with XRE-family HTH domain
MRDPLVRICRKRYNVVMAAERPQLRQARLAAGLTQQELADRLGVPQPVIARWESGDREPRVRAAVRLAEELGTTANAIWPPESERPDSERAEPAPKKRARAEV